MKSSALTTGSGLQPDLVVTGPGYQLPGMP